MLEPEFRKFYVTTDSRHLSVLDNRDRDALIVLLGIGSGGSIFAHFKILMDGIDIREVGIAPLCEVVAKQRRRDQELRQEAVGLDLHACVSIPSRVRSTSGLSQHLRTDDWSCD